MAEGCPAKAEEEGLGSKEGVVGERGGSGAVGRQGREELGEEGGGRAGRGDRGGRMAQKGTEGNKGGSEYWKILNQNKGADGRLEVGWEESPN